MSEQESLRFGSVGLWAVAWWGDDPFDATCLPSDGRLEVRGVPPDGVRKGVRALCLAPALPDGLLLASRTHGRTRIEIPDGVQASLRDESGRVSYPTSGESVELGMRAELRLRFGAFAVGLRHAAVVSRPDRHGAMDWDWARTGSLSGLVHGFALVAAQMTPAPDLIEVDLTKASNRVHQVLLRKAERGPAPEKDLMTGLKRRPKVDLRCCAATARKRRHTRSGSDAASVRDFGLLKTLANLDGASHTVLEASLGTGLKAALKGLRGPMRATVEDADMASRGWRGGDGRSVRIGRLAVHDEGGEDLHLWAKARHRPRIVPGRTISIGSLSKRQVNRVMQRNRPRFKFCYEKALSAKPDLRGKVSLRFEIAPNGRVARTSLAVSTAAHEPLESCLQDVLRSLLFPAPGGGGIVIVTYPFIFEST